MILGNVLQQGYNIVDTWVVGHYAGSNALAAVPLDPTKTYYCLFHYYPDPASTSGSWISNNYFYFIPSPLAEVDDLESQFGAPKVTVTDGTVEITAAEGLVSVDMHSMLGINYGHRSPLGAPTALTIETDRIPAGMYLVTVRTTCGLTVTKKITIR